MAYNERDFLTALVCGLMSKGRELRGNKAPTAYLYNGVQLPPLPESGKYSVIYSLPGVYYMTISEEPVPKGKYAYGAWNFNLYGDTYGSVESEWIFMPILTGGSVEASSIVWTSHDLYLNDGTLFMAASDPVPVYREPVAYLYNGLRFPSIDMVYTDDVKKTHPYAYIALDEWLYISSAPWKAHSVGNGYRYKVAEDAEIILAEVPTHGDKWVVIDTTEYAAGDTVTSGELNWSNVDVYTTDGTLYLAASKPVPVYESTTPSFALPDIKWFVGETYDSNTGLRKSGSRAITDIFLISATKDVRFSVDSCGYVICCYDEEGIYLGQPNRAKTALQKGKTDWVAAGTETTYFELLAIDPSIAQITIIAENPETPAFTMAFVLSPTAITDPESFLISYQIGCRLRMQRGRKEPVAYLYNGVQLPYLPDWDKSKYPYAWLDGNLYGERWSIDLVVSAKPLLYRSKSNEINTGDCAFRYWVFENGVWEEMSEYPDGGVLILEGLIWANHDVLYEDSGEVYFAASEPVPVYE